MGENNASVSSSIPLKQDKKASDMGAETKLAAPRVHAIKLSDIINALEAGLRDFRAAPAYGLFFGLVFAVGGNIVILCAFMADMSYLSYPLAAGFWMIGPFVAVGLYEVSRRLEKNEPLTWSGVLGVIWRQHRRELAWMAFVVLFILLMWMFEIRLLIALFLGFKGVSTMHEFVEVVLTTREGIMFLLVGHLVGAAFSIVLFSISVVSFPLLLEKDYDFVTAMITSVKVVVASPLPMLLWGASITVELLVSMLPAFLGLLFTLPVLGHATWHLYRAAISFEEDEELPNKMEQEENQQTKTN